MSNSSCEVTDDFKYQLYALVLGIIFIVGLIFNMVALYIFVFTLKERNETTTYMMNLAISDIFFVLTLPFRVFYFINRNWPFGDAFCKFTVVFFTTNMYSTILFLTCICADRFLAIVYPFASRSLRTKKKAKLACCVVWIIVLTASVYLGFQIDITNKGTNTTICFEKYSKDQWKSNLSKVVVFIELVGFLIPLLINIFCSVMIVRILRSTNNHHHGGHLDKIKVMRMIVVHLLIFCFCVVPYNVNLVFYTLVRSEVIENCTVQRVVKIIHPIAFCVAVSNCCFDPVIYYFTTGTFQKSIKRKSQAAHSSIKKCEDPDTEYTSVNKSIRAKFIYNESTL